MKQILQLSLSVTSFVAGVWFVENELKTGLIGSSIGIIIALLVQLGTFIYNERNFIKLYFDCYGWKKNAPLRLSVAYIFRIEVQGKYLLVKNQRFDNITYQPVGGVYKYFQPEADEKLRAMSIITDNSIENDEVSEFDLRVKMRKRKNLRNFIKWFFARTERETDPWREFYEELIATKILPAEDFRYMHYKLTGQHFEPIHYDAHFKVDTFKYVDIYAPRCINPKQKKRLKETLSLSSDDFIWATEEEIIKKRSNAGQRISDHAYKIFHTKKLK